MHLWALAGLPAPATTPMAVPAVTDAFQPVLDKLDPYPACIQNARFDVLAYNRGYRFLFGNLDALAESDRNCLRLLFTDGGWRSCFVDDEIVAIRVAAKLRAAMGAHVDDPRFVTLVADLRERSTDFDRLRSHDVMIQQYDVKRIDQPLVGLLQLNFVWSMTPPGSECR